MPIPLEEILCDALGAFRALSVKTAALLMTPIDCGLTLILKLQLAPATSEKRTSARPLATAACWPLDISSTWPLL